MNATAYADNLPLLRVFLRNNGIQGAFYEKLESRREWAVYEGPRPLGVGGFLVDTYRTKREAAAVVEQMNATICRRKEHGRAAAQA